MKDKNKKKEKWMETNLKDEKERIPEISHFFTRIFSMIPKVTI